MFIDLPEDFNPECMDILVYDEQGIVLADKEVRPQIPATLEEIQAKQAWLNLKPDSPENKLEIGSRLYKARRFDKAEAMLKTIPEDVPVIDEVYRILAEISYVKDDIENAHMWMDKAGRSLVTARLPAIWSDSPYATDQERIKQLGLLGTIAEADALFSQNRINEAADLISDASIVFENSYSVLYYVMGYLSVKCKSDMDTAERMFRKASQLSFEYVNPFTRLERLALEYATEHYKDDAIAWLLLGNYWSRLNQEKACKVWNNVIKADPNNYLALRNLAYITMRARENIAYVLDSYQKALSIKPGSVDLIIEYIHALRLNKDVKGALQYLDSLDPCIRCDVRITKARILLLKDNGFFEEAIEVILSSDDLFVWEGEHDLHRCYLECLMELGYRSLKKKDYNNARKWFGMMLDYPEQLVHGRSYDENESAAYYHLGLLYEGMGNQQLAREYYERAVKQPYPSIYHAVSYRENEYYAGLAAKKIGNNKTLDMVVQRLLSCYTGDNSELNVDFMPLGGLYWPYLAAARGFILAEQYDTAIKVLETGEKYAGKCWAFDLERKYISSLLCNEKEAQMG